MSLLAERRLGQLQLFKIQRTGVPADTESEEGAVILRRHTISSPDLCLPVIGITGLTQAPYPGAAHLLYSRDPFVKPLRTAAAERQHQIIFPLREFVA